MNYFTISALNLETNKEEDFNYKTHDLNNSLQLCANDKNTIQEMISFLEEMSPSEEHDLKLEDLEYNFLGLTVSNNDCECDDEFETIEQSICILEFIINDH